MSSDTVTCMESSESVQYSTQTLSNSVKRGFAWAPLSSQTQDSCFLQLLDPCFLALSSQQQTIQLSNQIWTIFILNTKSEVFPPKHSVMENRKVASSWWYWQLTYFKDDAKANRAWKVPTIPQHDHHLHHTLPLFLTEGYMQLLADGQTSGISQQVTFAYIYMATTQLFKGSTLGLMTVCRV